MPKGIPKAGFRQTKNRVARADARAAVHAPVEVETAETDEEIRHKLSERFRIIKKLGKSACGGAIRSGIIAGPPGVGKSFGIEEVLAEYDPEGDRTVVQRGVARSTGIYKTLYEYRQPGCVVVFDDCDSIFFDMDSLNLLKTACDTTKKRRLYWGAETKMQDAKGKYLPTSFEFEGTVLFITNFDFDDAIEKGSKLAPHFEALISRSHYIDTGMKSIRDYLIRIEQVIDEGMLKSRGLNADQQKQIVRFVKTNASSLRELTLRMVIKLSDLMLAEPHDWKDFAKVTLFKKGK